MTLPITGSGSITKAGTGGLTFAVANTYTGGTTVNAGTLSLGASNVLPDTGGLTVSGGTLSMGAYSDTVGAVTVSGGAITGSTGVLTGSSYTVNNSSGTATLSAKLAGTGGLTKSGAGTLTLSGANTYSGATTINGGVLSIAADNNLGTAPGSATASKLVINNGTLNTTGTLTLNTFRGITLTNTGTVDVGSGTTLSYGGIMASSGGLTKSGLGTLSLSGPNTYTGATTISGGTLSVSGALSDSTALTVGSGATYNVNASDTVLSVAGTGTISTSLAGLKTLTLGGTSDSSNFEGVMQDGTGSLALTKTGSGTLTLTGNNSYTGATTISAGALILTNDAPTTGATTFGGAGTLRIEPASTDFSADFSTLGWSFGATLGGLVLGKASSADGTGDRSVAINSTIGITGPVSVYGNGISVNNAVSTSQSGAAVMLKGSGSIQAGANITTHNGNIMLWSNADGSASGGISLASDVVLNSANGSTTATTGAGKIVIAGGLDNGANGGTVSDGLPDGYTTGTISASNLSLYSGGGDITVRGSATSGSGIAFAGSTTIRSGNGRVVMRGESTDSHGIDLNGVNSAGIVSVASSSSDGSNPAIDIEGRTTSTTAATWGLGLFSSAGGTIQATGTAGIRLWGQTASGNFDYYSIGADLLATSGAISVTANGSSTGLLHQGYLGRKAATSVTSSASNIELVADKISNLSQLNIASTGQLTVKPFSNSFSSDLSWPIRNGTNPILSSLSSDVSGLTLGKSSNTSNITLTDALTVAGPVTLYGTNITTGAITATGSTITLQGTGNVTLGGNVTASSARLVGGNVSFNGSINTIGTLAASGVGNLSLVNSGALTIGTVGSTNGISASGTVSIATQKGDLTVSQNISAANLVLSADRDSAVGGAGTGGNVKFSGSPSITVSGLGKIYTGSVTGSTGVTTLVGSGSGRFRYNSDEASAGYDTANSALSSGLYAIYRQQPIITLITAANVSTAYASTPAYAVTLGGGVNGDTATQVLSGVTFAAGDANSARSLSNNLVVGTHTITATGGSSLLGYAVSPSYATGTLTLTPKQLTVPGSNVANKDYDGTTNATLSGGSLVGVVGFDAVSLVHGGSFNSKHAALSVNVTSSHALNGADIANYDLVQPTGLVATISPKAITATAAIGGTFTRAYNGTTSASGASVTGTVAGAIAGDNLAFVGGAYTLAYNDAHVAHANAINASGTGSFAVSSSTAGSLVSDYALTQPSVAPVVASITPAPLTATLSNTSVTRDYNGNTDAPAGFTPTWAITGLVSGDTAASLLHTGAAYNSKDVLMANKVTVSGVSMGSITGNKGSQPSDYQVASSSDVAATITPKSLTLAGLTASDKVYDGRSDVVPVTNWGAAATGVGSESLSLTHGPANLGAAGAGSQTVTVANYVLVDGPNAELASNYVLPLTSATTPIMVNKAPLTVRAKDDAKFITMADVSGYNGVALSGFVNGESASVVNGSAVITRNNSAVNDPGIYPNVLALNVTGLGASNYSFTPVNGSFTIVPSNQLLVRVSDASTVYGSAASYAITSAQYFNGSAPVNLSGITADGANSFTVADGVGGTATFTLTPAGVSNSGANKTPVGTWQLGLQGAATLRSGWNFSNALTVVGTHSVAAKPLTASAGTVSKVYDGSTSSSSVSLDLAPKETGDTVTAGGVGQFSTRHVGAGLRFDVDGVTLQGADALNYYLLSGTHFTGNTGAITAKPITLTPRAGSRAYNGQTALTASADDVTHLSNQLGVVGDSVSAVTLAFNDKNVATGKTLTATAVTVSDGNDGNNYSITLGANTSSSITRLNTVTWTGGNSGNWFDPANWAGGAVPDLANVAHVVIPAGVNVSFDKSGAQSPVDTSGVVSLDSLGAQGSLTQANGALNMGTGGMQLAS